MTTILVVDDEADLQPLLLSWFRRKIQQTRYTFHFARNGREALGMLRSEPAIDLILLDINMPEIDGLTLLNELPALNPMLRAVMVSAYGDMENIRTAMNRGAFDFVCKPIDLKDLGITIEKTAQHVRQLRESHQLRVIDELKTRFFDNITHEFRTPLTLILSPVEQLLQRYREPVDLQQNLLLVQRNARQLLQLINQLLDLARLEAGHLTLSPKAGDLIEFLRQIVGLFEPLAREKGLNLIFDNQLTGYYVFDADKLEQIIYNLISNAIKFTNQGEVVVRLVAHSGVQFIVADTGIAIAPEKLPYIFNRFYQVQVPEPTTTGPHFSPPGTGIGLALVKELTELMGGIVSVVSTPPGSGAEPAGTTFTVELPLQQVDGEVLPVERPQPWLPVVLSDSPVPQYQYGLPDTESEAQPALILVVEDNPELNAFLARELAHTYRVLTATDGLTGWQIAQAELPDVVLTDVMMPGIDGHELTHRLKTDPATDHIAVVMLTAKTSQPSRIEGLKLGADDYISKPFHVDELKLRIHNLISRQNTLRTHFNAHITQPDTPIHSETLADKFVQRLYAILDTRLDDSKFRVDELAEQIGMSRRTLHRKLSAVANLTVNDFIRQYRLKRGMELLQQGYNVSETAYMVGYESPAYFSTVFKEFFGKTPTEYLDR
jgi:signal transduction histidine kinase/AraC-like DNA-binding protein